MKKKVLLSFIFYTVLLFGYSQEMKINGSVVDTNVFLPLYGAKAYLVNLEDSVITRYQNTDKQGHFEFTVPLSTYRLFISYPAYASREFLLVGTQEHSIFELGHLQMDDDFLNLGEVAIYAYKDPIYYRGDTLVYVADSFATRENAVVEDLLKQLPGIVVETDGRITSQGNQISKVYVDGDEFFGADPTIATKNLAAKSIDQVQVYEMEAEGASIGDEKIQVLDLKLKEEAKKGWFAKANVASDFNNFHEGQLLFNRFTSDYKIFAFGLGSNTLNSSLSSEDVAMANAGGSAMASNISSGHPETYRSGVFFSQKVNQKLNFDGDYSFSDFKTNTVNENSIQYLLKDTTYFSDEAAQRNVANQTHHLSLNFNVNIDSTQDLTISPKFSFSQSENTNTNITTYKDENRASIRQASNQNESNSESINASLNLHYTKKFAKERRRLVLRDYVSYNQNNTINHLNYFDYFYFTALTDNEILQQKENETANFSNTFTARFTEPLKNDRWRLNFDYELFNNLNNQDRYSYDWDGTAYTKLDSLTSNVFNTSRLENKLGFSITYNTTSHNLTFGVRERNLQVQNEDHFTGNIIHQNELSTLPFLTYRYRISQNSRITTRVSTNSSLPSISYLSPSRNNSNPNAILEGNESLQSNYNINASANYSVFKRISEVAFNTGISARYTFNDFARSLTYDSLGRSISVYENINTFNNTTLRTSLSLPMFKRILRVNPSFDYTHSNQNNIVDGINNLTRSHHFTPGIKLTINSDFLALDTDIRFTERIGKNSANSNLNINSSVWNLNSDLTIYLPLKFELNISGNYYKYANLSQNFNSEFLIVNTSINKKIGKYNGWEIGLEGYDLLNQNTQISRTITANTRIDARSDIISRYFLLRISYLFNSTFRINDENKQ